MRILVVADIHANRPALEAIREPFDACFCLGDVVEYGPEPGPCVEWVRANATAAVRGNHDHGAAQNADVFGQVGFRYLTTVTRRDTVAKLTEADRRFLADLPTTQMLTLGGLRFLLVHASPRDPLEEYMQPDPAAWQARLGSLKVDFVCGGHTHHQYTLQAGRTTVLNPGSVGLPRDGDPRVRYAVIEDGKVELKQVEYDIDAACAAVVATDIEAEAKAKITGIYRTGRYQFSLPPGTNGVHTNGKPNGVHSQRSATTPAE